MSLYSVLHRLLRGDFCLAFCDMNDRTLFGLLHLNKPSSKAITHSRDTNLCYHINSTKWHGRPIIQPIPHFWNRLPLPIKQSTSLTTFEKPVQMTEWVTVNSQQGKVYLMGDTKSPTNSG